MNLDELTERLFARTTRGVRFGLERTERLLAGVGNPHRHFRSVLIGGTNGKGSVAAFCEAALREEGVLRIGLYTSPHLVSFSERIRIDGIPVAEHVLTEAAERLMPLVEESGATFFEATTALGFLVFAEAGVELAVVEVGLGGRLDSTNVLGPLAVAITNVARDHGEYLGDDLASITREKAGILKPATPAVVGIQEPELIEIVRGRADEVGAELYPLDDVSGIGDVSTDLSGTEFELRSEFWGDRKVRIPLPGAHQARNAALAAELLALLPRESRPDWGAVERGFAATRWPGRLQIERCGETTLLLDVAHNPAGAASLASALDDLNLPGPRALLFGVMADKEWKSMLPPLIERTSAAWLTVPESAPATRRWNPAAAAAWIREEVHREVRVVPDLEEAVRQAIDFADGGTVVITGSVHTVGDAMVALGLGGSPRT